ncbi:MAG: hypothetical protein H7311_03195 [Ramlibacter sp.]|nr:hypothetical protein [Cryobacterium sp.]
MSETRRVPAGQIDFERYEIRLQGQLDESWSNWFVGFTLTGPVLDQAALHGLLRRVGDLGATLISVNGLGSTAS